MTSFSNCNFSLKFRCLCSAGKVSGKGASVVEYLIQLFYKRLDALGFDNKQVDNHSRNFTISILGCSHLLFNMYLVILQMIILNFSL